MLWISMRQGWPNIIPIVAIAAIPIVTVIGMLL